MAEIDDLKAAVATIGTAVSDVVAELKAVADALNALKTQGTINPADVEAAAQSVTTLATNLEAAVAETKGSTGV